MTDHLSVTFYLSKTRTAMKVQKERRTLPASTGAPKVVQDTRIGEGTNLGERPTRNDELGPKPAGSLRSEKRRKDSRAQRAKKKKKKKVLKIGIWNIRTLLPDGKFEFLIDEIKNLNVNILGISETRWAGSGHFEQEGYYVVYSG